MASTHNDFFDGQTDRGLNYWPDHSGELGCSNKKKKKGAKASPAIVALLHLITRGNLLMYIFIILFPLRDIFTQVRHVDVSLGCHLKSLANFIK